MGSDRGKRGPGDGQESHEVATLPVLGLRVRLRTETPSLVGSFAGPKERVD